MLKLITSAHKWEKGQQTTKATSLLGIHYRIRVKNRKRTLELQSQFQYRIPKYKKVQINWVKLAATLVQVNAKTAGRIQRKKINQVKVQSYSSFDNTRAFPLQQQLFTNDRLHIFRVVVDIEEVTSSQGIVQGFLKGSQVVKNFGSNQSGKLAAPKTFIFIENFTAEEGEKSISSVCSDLFKAT